MIAVLVPGFALKHINTWADEYLEEREKVAVRVDDPDEPSDEPLPPKLWMTSDEDGETFFIVESEHAADFAKMLRFDGSMYAAHVARELEKVKC